MHLEHFLGRSLARGCLQSKVVVVNECMKGMERYGGMAGNEMKIHLQVQVMV
jgi:hypothetical protein